MEKNTLMSVIESKLSSATREGKDALRLDTIDAAVSNLWEQQYILFRL
jgi:hypothetical protein